MAVMIMMIHLLEDADGPPTDDPDDGGDNEVRSQDIEKGS